MAYSIDGPTKVITLTAGTTILSVRDLWSRWVDWILTGDNSKYLIALNNVGGDDIDPGEGTKIPIYAFLMNGWKIKPQEANHTLVVNDGILLVNGGGDPFVNTTGAYTVRINYQQPVQAISFDSGGGTGTAPTVEEIRQEMDVNSSKLTDILDAVNNIAIAGSVIIYTPTSATRVIGSDQGGTVTDLIAHDDVDFVTGEVSGQGLDVEVLVSSSTITENPSVCRIVGYYAGSVSHSVGIYAWNYANSSWELKGTMLSRSAAFDYAIPLTLDNQNGAGEMQLRFLHSVATYLSPHRLYLDYIVWEKTESNSQLGSDVASIKMNTEIINTKVQTLKNASILIGGTIID